MVSAKLLQIFATGPQDKILYGNPKITYFKTVYKQHTNFGSNYIVKDLSSYAAFGKTLRFKVPREGDLLGATYIRFGLSLKNTDTPATNPYYSSFCNGIGSILIEEIGIYVGGKRLESFPGEWIMLDNEIYNDNSRKKEFYKMIGYKDFEFNIGTHGPPYDISSSTTIGAVRNQEGDNLGDIDILVPIPFFYTKDTGFYLPVCAMNEENIEIVLKLRNSADCIVKNVNSANATAAFTTNGASNSSIGSGEIIDEQVDAQITSMEMIYNYYYLDDREKQYFMNNDHRYIIPIAKQGIKNNFNYVSNNQSMKTTLDIKHPVKFIAWTLQRESILKMNDYFNYTYSPTVGDHSVNRYFYDTIPDPDKNMVNTFNFDIDGHPLLDKLPSKILNSAELYSKFKNNSNLLFYLYSFSLHPRDIYPSGTLNFSRIKDTDIKFTLSDKSSQADNAQVAIPNYTSDKFIMTPYTVYYNILSIKDGLSGLEFI